MQCRPTNLTQYVSSFSASDSWVDVQGSSGENSPKRDVVDPEKSALYMPLNIEKLLKDAQKESTNTSRESSARGRWVTDLTAPCMIDIVRYAFGWCFC